MPKTIYPAGTNILNTPIDNKIIPIINKISSIHFAIILKHFVSNQSPPYAVLFTNSKNVGLLSI